MDSLETLYHVLAAAILLDHQHVLIDLSKLREGTESGRGPPPTGWDLYLMEQLSQLVLYRKQHTCPVLPLTEDTTPDVLSEFFLRATEQTKWHTTDLPYGDDTGHARTASNDTSPDYDVPNIPAARSTSFRGPPTSTDTTDLPQTPPGVDDAFDGITLGMDGQRTSMESLARLCVTNTDQGSPSRAGHTRFPSVALSVSGLPSSSSSPSSFLTCRHRTSREASQLRRPTSLSSISTNRFVVLLHDLHLASPVLQTCLLETLQHRQFFPFREGDVMPLSDRLTVVATFDPSGPSIPHMVLERFMWSYRPVPLTAQRETTPLASSPISMTPITPTVDTLTASPPPHTTPPCPQPPTPLSPPWKTPRELREWAEHLDSVYVAPVVTGYIHRVVVAVRQHPAVGLKFPVWRAPHHLTLASKAWALLLHRSFVVPCDVFTVAPMVFAHRLTLAVPTQLHTTRQQDTTDAVTSVVSGERRRHSLAVRTAWAHSDPCDDDLALYTTFYEMTQPPWTANVDFINHVVGTVPTP